MLCSLLLAVCLLAAGYHMLQRVSFETDLAETCRRHNVSLLAYSPLAGKHARGVPNLHRKPFHRTQNAYTLVEDSFLPTTDHVTHSTSGALLTTLCWHYQH
jgi:aryl-alcohol dehydrogenase-like predicted oxidoreductase